MIQCSADSATFVTAMATLGKIPNTKNVHRFFIGKPGTGF
jgi:hypothetical protein